MNVPRELLARILTHADYPNQISPGEGAPNHSHRKPGHWDADDTPCQICADWNELRVLLAMSPEPSYPIDRAPHVIQFHDETFVWYDEAGIAAGVAYTLADAQRQLDEYGKSLDTPRPADRLAELLESGERLAPWLSASLDDQKACAEFKEAVRGWLYTHTAIQGDV